MRLEALKFLVHFVGDVHQPLHAANDNDRGGNDIDVKFAGYRSNLHKIWDTEILASAHSRDERSYALLLLRSVNDRTSAAWRMGRPVDWANESHAIASRVIYRHLPERKTSLPIAYGTSALPVVNEQLLKAGIRLAAVLNDALH